MSSFVYNVKVNAMQSVLDSAIKETVVKLSKKYEFDYHEALAFLGVEEKLRVTIGAKAKEPRAPKREQPKFPLPFSGQIIDNCCLAVLYNKGLYSQCLNEPGTDGLCTSCSRKAAKSPFGKPEFGTINERLEQGDDYCDYKGKKPVHFTKIMKNMQLTEEFVLSEVTKYNLPFDTNHFSEQQAKKGRPKKIQETNTNKPTRAKKATNKIEVSVLEEDFIEKMVEEKQMGNTPRTPSFPPPTSPNLPLAPTLLLPAPALLPPAPALLAPAPALNPLKLSLKQPELEEGEISDLTDEDEPNNKPVQKNTKKGAKEAEKAKKEAEKEAKRLEKAKKEAEKEAKRLEKEAKEAEKAKKEAEKEAKRLEKEAKEAEKAKKEAKKPQPQPQPQPQPEPEQKISNDELSVEKFDEEPEKPKAQPAKAKYVMFSGKKYIVKLEDNTVYDAETKYEVGYWNPKEETIVFEEDEEEEDEEEEEEEEGELVEDSDEE